MKTTNKSTVSLVDYMGSDLSVVNSARVSFDKMSDWEEIPGQDDGVQLSSQDTKLIKYLAKHNHWSPFAHTSVSLRISAPIFVARQLVKHQVGLCWNEVSRRYVDDEPEFYFPKEWRGKPVNAKQGSDGVFDIKFFVGGNKEVMDVHATELCYAAVQLYTQAVHNGMAPEQARMILPQNTMTSWIWTGSLMAFTRVCKQRLDPHAQLETREVAEQIAPILQELFPVSFQELMNT
jgi:thymidylate synthase (FAD)